MNSINMTHKIARMAFLKPRLLRALKQNDVIETSRLINAGMDVDTTFYSDIYSVKPAICISIEEGSTKVAMFLIENGCSVNLSTGMGATPLHLAVFHKNYELVRVLLKNRANVNAKDSNLETPLHLVCYTGCFATYTALINAGADLNVTDVDHRTPLMLACFSRKREIALSLIDKGADVRFRDNRGNTALEFALCYEPCLALIQALIHKGAEVNADGFPSVPIVTFLRHLHQNFPWCISEACLVLKLLIDSGCKLNFTTYSGHTPLHIAVAVGHVEIVKMLLNAGCESTADMLGRTPLFYACFHNYCNLVKLLIANGIKWNEEHWILDKTLRATCNENLVRFCDEESCRFPRLIELSRSVIRRVLGPEVETCIDQLRYPPLLKEYIKLDHF